MMDHRLAAIIEIIQRDLATHIDWRKIAFLVGLSPSWLRLLFKQTTGMPPSKYLKELRLERSRILLCQSTSKSVKEVMAAVGLSDESHFVRDFKKRYGDYPKDFRRRFLTESGPAGESAKKLALRPTNFA